VPVSAELNADLDLPVALDAGATWTSPLEAYEWAHRELWPQTNHHVLVYQHPQSIPFFDYLVAFRVFPICICQNSPLEVADLFERLLRETPPNIPVMGCWGTYGERPRLTYGENALVTLCSRYGKPFVVTRGCTNLTVHSGVPVTEDELRQRPSPPMALDPAKVYLAFDYSDGDNLQYVQGAFNGPRWWGDEERGRVNLGWSIGPSAVDLMPDILAYYYDTATPADEFLAAVSGAGYCYPDVYGDEYGTGRRRILRGFLRTTHDVMAQADLSAVNPFRGSRELYEEYARAIPLLGGILADYGRGVRPTYEQANYAVADGRVPVFRNLVCYGGEGDNITATVDEVRAVTPDVRPAFLHVFVINWWTTPADLVKVMEELGDEYVACTPSQFVGLWRQSRSGRGGTETADD
jgi:hypothetical protein